MAEVGVFAATRANEGQFGFLQAFGPSKKDLARLTSDLGREWIWLNSTFKPFPACQINHCFIEMAGRMVEVAASKKAVKCTKLSVTTANYSIVGERTSDKQHLQNSVDVQFSARPDAVTSK